MKKYACILLIFCCSCCLSYEDCPGDNCETDCEQDLDIIQRDVCPDGVGIRYIAYEKVDQETLIQMCEEAK